MAIKQAIIPAAGIGSRFLPVTKNIPKELLPLIDKPCIQHVIEEGIKAGVEEFIIVISKEKTLIQSYFEENAFIEKWLLKRNQTDVYQKVKEIENKAKYQFIIQEEPLGLGHAVLCARSYIKDDHFFVLLPDDIIDAEIPVCQQMVEIYKQQKKPIVSVMEVPWDDVHRYGIVQAEPLSETLGEVISIIEKPDRQNAPSNLAVIGRYLLPKQIFELLESTSPGKAGEIQLTDALKELITSFGLNSFAFKGDRYDAGIPIGLLKASVVLSLKNPDYRDQMVALIKMLASSI